MCIIVLIIKEINNTCVFQCINGFYLTKGNLHVHTHKGPFIQSVSVNAAMSVAIFL